MLNIIMTAFLSFTIVNGSNAIGDDPYVTSTASLGKQIQF